MKYKCTSSKSPMNSEIFTVEGSCIYLALGPTVGTGNQSGAALNLSSVLASAVMALKGQLGYLNIFFRQLVIK